MKTYDIVCGLIFAVIAVSAYIVGLSFPKDNVMAIGPSYFPNILAGGLFLFSAVLVGRGAFGKATGSGKGLGFSLKDKGTRRLFVSVVIALLFVATLKTIGFMLDCTLVVLLYLLLLGVKRPLYLVLVPPAVTVAVYLVFEKFLSISLPMGVLGGIF